MRSPAPSGASCSCLTASVAKFSESAESAGSKGRPRGGGRDFSTGPERKIGGGEPGSASPEAERAGARLEVELQRELDRARAVRRRDDGRVAGGHVHDPVVAERAALGLRALERRVVEDVEELGAELEAGRLGQARELHERLVPVDLERAAEDVAPEVPDGGTLHVRVAARDDHVLAVDAAPPGRNAPKLTKPLTRWPM